MPKFKKTAKHTKSEPQPNLPLKPAASIPSLPPEIYLLIAGSLAAIDQLHLGLTCKSLFFLTAPDRLGEALIRQPRQKATHSGIFYDAYCAGFVNLELYDYLLERTKLHSFEFELICKVAGRRGDIGRLELWSQKYERQIPLQAAEGAAEAGDISFLKLILDRRPAGDASRIFDAAAQYAREDVLDYLHGRFDLTPRELSEAVKSAAYGGHIDFALKLYRRLPFCCSRTVLETAAKSIASCSIKPETEGWQAVLAEFLETPSFMSESIGQSAFMIAASDNRVDVMRFLDEKYGRGTCHRPSSALSSALEGGSAEAFDYICQTRPNWTSFVDEAVQELTFEYNSSIDASVAFVRRVMPHAKKRFSLITLMRKALCESEEVLEHVAKEFRRRFGPPSQDDLVLLYSGVCELEAIEALTRHFPPQSTEHADEIVRFSNDPFEMMEFLRQFCPDINSDIEVWSDY